MYKFRCILIWHFPSVLLVFTWPLMGKLNFRRYVISRFYPTREIRENLMHVKNVFYSKPHQCVVTKSEATECAAMQRTFKPVFIHVGHKEDKFIQHIYTGFCANTIEHHICQWLQLLSIAITNQIMLLCNSGVALKEESYISF